MGKIRYTVTTYTRSCPQCGEELERESKGELTPILACLWIFTFPIMLSYYLLHFFAFSCPTQRKVGAKFESCPNCSEIIKTKNFYIEELYGEDLLNHKFKPLFYLAYTLGVALLLAFVSFSAGFSVIKLAITLIIFCALAGIIISYRVLLCKYKQQVQPRVSPIVIEKMIESEFIELYERLHETSKKDSVNSSKQISDTCFVTNHEKQISDHKKWLSDAKQGKQLIVQNEVIQNINIQGIRIQNSKFIGCTFKNMDLSNVSFRRCDLSNSKFIGCNLGGTDFAGAILNGTQFKKCDMASAIFDKKSCHS